MVVQPGLCGTWSETPKTGFLTTRLISSNCDKDGKVHLPVFPPVDQTHPSVSARMHVHKAVRDTNKYRTSTLDISS